MLIIARAGRRGRTGAPEQKVRRPFGRARNSLRPQQEQIERELLCGPTRRDNSHDEAAAATADVRASAGAGVASASGALYSLYISRPSSAMRDGVDTEETMYNEALYSQCPAFCERCPSRARTAHASTVAAAAAMPALATCLLLLAAVLGPVAVLTCPSYGRKLCIQVQGIHGATGEHRAAVRRRIVRGPRSAALRPAVDSSAARECDVRRGAASQCGPGSVLSPLAIGNA
ncbi:hypothetical protein EVAR_39184_1 [Eumeta japonica]|uniref:Uncharacterized protein n=1 Tax=Eumeta variegata TaxID=151549 RepID=A0A4C1VLP4_EUMVA|nr:hypothetical protein EVAR_39184_1 [Eumeta japonica]